MMKYILMTVICLMLASCGGEKKSADFLYGSRLYEKFVGYYLRGEARLAERAFANAETQFMKTDSVCNISRMYIGRYVLDEGGEDLSILDRAMVFAELEKCLPEIESIRYLSGEKYDKNILPEPYRMEAGLDAKGLAELAGDKKLADYTRSRLYRKASVSLLKDSPDESAEYAGLALEIDKFNGWSLNILRDLMIIKFCLQRQGLETKEINKRIELLKTVLDKN
jgi:hypothetical protein